jgi:outer membrane protein OmpA-like peptidoglycan-associated protein/subtilisin family serine protease
VDPALWELLRAEAGADGDRVLEAIIRLARPGIEIPDIRIVSRFGTVATCRIRARDIVPVRARHDVVSLKAAHGLSPGFEPTTGAAAADALPPAGFRPADVRRSPGLTLTGKGVVVASVDWGLDVDSAAFRWSADPAAAGGNRPVGGTRFLSFWDQRDLAAGPRPDPYGYGTVHDREQIDRALHDPRPYEQLGYHPAIADRGGHGTHGTHVLDIAAGNGQAGGPAGIAPEADLIFVHLADRTTGGLANLGDSVRLLEAVDFISRMAGSQPCVINISAGRTCGPKDGTTLVERALDELLAATPGRFVVNSVGNYFGWRTHSCGRIAPEESRSLTFVIDPADITLNELEIWYDGADEFAVRIDPPGYTGSRAVRLGERSDLLIEGQAVGRVYHRRHDPNNGDNHIVAYIDPIGRAGNWTVTLEARQVKSGRFHAWIERDDTCRGCQARFTLADSSPVTTIGTIAASRVPLIVGAYDGHDPVWPVAPFSSSGPSRDHRPKPDLVAPGVDVLAARSASIIDNHNPGLLVRKSGTSMATPHVTGAVALCLQAAGNTLSARQIRSLVLGSCDPARDPDSPYRLGRGYLNIPRLIIDLQRALTAPSTKEPTMNTDDSIVQLAAAPATAYREYLYRPRSPLASWINDRFEVVASPGQRLDQAPQLGDVLLEVTLGRVKPGRCLVLKMHGPELEVSPRRLSAGQLLLRPRKRAAMSEPLPVEPTVETEGSALDAAVAAEHEFAGPDSEEGRMPVRADITAARRPDFSTERATVVESLVPPPEPTTGSWSTKIPGVTLDETRDAEDVDAPPWTGSPEQLAFSDRVLEAHLALSRQGGAPQRDLSRDELERVPGSEVMTARATALAAGRLLAAANADLRTAQQAGDPDALRTLRLTVISGYRSSQRQRALWLRYFSRKDGYYDRTRAARGKLADGPHSEQAIAYLLRPRNRGGFGLAGRIAAPGYSNHQGGIAVDFLQERAPGYPVANDSGDAARARWRATWFHKWLIANAADYGFRPLPTEEWHWTYRSASSSAAAPASADATRAFTTGQDMTFRSDESGNTHQGAQLLAHEQLLLGRPREAASQPMSDFVLDQARSGNAAEAAMPPNLVLAGYRLDQASIPTVHRSQLMELVRDITQRIGRREGLTAQLRIVGHTDASGTEVHNETLGRQRALGVRDVVAAALPPTIARRVTFAVTSEGERAPLASNLTNEGRAQNRRVEISVDYAEPAVAVDARPARPASGQVDAGVPQLPAGIVEAPVDIDMLNPVQTLYPLGDGAPLEVRFTIPHLTAIIADKVIVSISDGTLTPVYEEVLPTTFLTDGTYLWQWDGRNTNGVFDAGTLTRQLALVLTFEEAGKVTNIRSKFLKSHTTREWVTAKMDRGAKAIAVDVYVDCQNEENLRATEFQRLRSLVLSGIGKYWSRSVAVVGDVYTVTTTAHQRSAASVHLDLYVETDADYRRSHNSGIIDASIFYNQGHYGGANANTDHDFEETAAHEFGHSILWAVGGKSLSWGHKGTVNASLLKFWNFQDPSPSATKYPVAGEIDLMKYYTDSEPGDFYSRVIVASEDVFRLIGLSSVTLSLA